MNELHETEFERLFREKRAGPKAPFNLQRFLRQTENYTPIDELLALEASKKPKKCVRFASKVEIKIIELFDSIN